VSDFCEEGNEILGPRKCGNAFGNYATNSFLINVMINGVVIINIANNNNDSNSSSSSINCIVIEKIKEQNYTLFPNSNKIVLHNSPTPY
jgi:hypothetical protein